MNFAFIRMYPINKVHCLNYKLIMMNKNLKLPFRSFYICSKQGKASDPIVEKTSENSQNVSKPKLSQILAEYGTTGIAFHTAVAATSIGLCYVAVSTGVDVVGLLHYLNLMDTAFGDSVIGEGATTFIIAYACHTVTFPIRSVITVASTPILVKKLRQLGIIKQPFQPCLKLAGFQKGRKALIQHVVKKQL